jgi:hypothetical protein
MAVADLSDWILEFARPGTFWVAKRLSANDTLANQAHQAGPYIPKELLFEVFPSLNRPADVNPDHRFDIQIDSHGDHRTVRAVWYNNKVRGEGTRNEARITGFGGAQSALLDADSTGSLTVFVFLIRGNGDADECHVWVCEKEIEEDVLEDQIGPVEPGSFVVWQPGTDRAPDLFRPRPKQESPCRLAPEEMPQEWLAKFPSGSELIHRTVQLRPCRGMSADERLMRRRACEYELFQGVEEAFYLPRIGRGFNSIDGFVSLAQTILQSRKSRSGKSLELHAREIWIEEGLRPDIDFAHGPKIDSNNRPDFIFPSVDAYRNPDFPESRLRMLAAKTTCRERWPQILSEADRIKEKHLLTLQEGVSEPQFEKMCNAGIRLVVPAGLHDRYSSVSTCADCTEGLEARYPRERLSRRLSG